MKFLVKLGQLDHRKVKMDSKFEMEGVLFNNLYGVINLFSIELCGL